VKKLFSQFLNNAAVSIGAVTLNAILNF